MAVIFPQLLLKLAQLEQVAPLVARCPQAVVLVENTLLPIEAQAILQAVNPAAEACGIVPGLPLVQALNLYDELQVLAVSQQQLVQKLQQFTTVALQLGSPVSFELPDTIWVEITGSSHLFQGEEGTALALHQLLLRQGHDCHIAVSDGPWSAQALARFGQSSQPSTVTNASHLVIVRSSELESAIGRLPIRALPLSSRAISWLNRLGLRTVVDLRKLPQVELLARLKGETFPGTKAFSNCQRTFLEQIQGRDHAQLYPYRPDPAPQEQTAWDEPMVNVDFLLTPIGELLGRLSARLQERGQAIRQLSLTLKHDPAIARHRKCALQTTIHFSLITPLQHANDLLRIVHVRLERYVLLAPVLAMRLQSGALTLAPQWQLSLNQATLNHSTWGLATLGPLARCADPQALELLFAELVADLGEAQVGQLTAQQTPLLEERSLFHPLLLDGITPSYTASVLDRKKSFVQISEPKLGPRAPTRVLTPPVRLATHIQKSELLVWQGCTYRITRRVFVQRLEQVQWWQGAPTCRDYYQLWLVGPSVGSEPGNGLSLLAFLEHSKVTKGSTQSYVHALFD